eukprot:616151-Rhodomonas_salina.2
MHSSSLCSDSRLGNTSTKPGGRASAWSKLSADNDETHHVTWTCSGLHHFAWVFKGDCTPRLGPARARAQARNAPTKPQPRRVENATTSFIMRSPDACPPRITCQAAC